MSSRFKLSNTNLGGRGTGDGRRPGGESGFGPGGARPRIEVGNQYGPGEGYGSTSRRPTTGVDGYGPGERRPGQIEGDRGIYYIRSTYIF